MSAEAFASSAARYCTNFRTVSGVLGLGLLTRSSRSNNAGILVLRHEVACECRIGHPYEVTYASSWISSLSRSWHRRRKAGGDAAMIVGSWWTSGRAGWCPLNNGRSGRTGQSGTDRLDPHRRRWPWSAKMPRSAAISAVVAGAPDLERAAGGVLVVLRGGMVLDERCHRTCATGHHVDQS